MKLKNFSVLLAIMTFANLAFSQFSYNYTLDLTNVVDDKVFVELLTPKADSDEIEFQMPKVVPGTYSISDFGRFLHDLKAFNAAGEELKVLHSEEEPNRWKISGATGLHKISYWVEDSWDTDQSGSVFEPGGTNIEDKANFVLNNFGFFGYLEGKKEQTFHLTIKKPAGFYGSTALIATSNTSTEEKYTVKGYNLLADSPIMFCEPDTVTLQVGGAEVLVSVYSPSDMTHADAIMKGIAPILKAQRKYLGGTLPVKKYAFICYLVPSGKVGGGMGALEHSYSSFYYMPEVSDDRAGDMMKDVAAHEFFHIVTPLSVHSEEIHYFDYIDPKMSKHLWLYEGVTEYSAGHVQVCYDLMTVDQYLDLLKSKIVMSSYFMDEVPFTEISGGCLHEYKSQYTNVYQKGALIGAAVDIHLRDMSDGKMGLQDLMRRLEWTFGTEQPFKDAELFDVITKLTFPGIRKFFKEYVEGPNPLPYAEIFDKVGVTYQTNVDREVLTMGRVGLEVNLETSRFKIGSTRRANKFGKDMGYRSGDEFLSFDGKEVTVENFGQVVAQFRANHKAGDKIEAVVLRPDGKGSYKEKKLKGKAITVNQKEEHLLELSPNASERQIRIRNAWLNH